MLEDFPPSVQAMTDLIQRLTDATGNERGLFEEAWLERYGKDPRWFAWYGDDSPSPAEARRFTAMLDAEAWTSAAEMLVPDKCFWGIDTTDGYCEACVGPHDPIMSACFARAATPALALLIAALKAHGGNDAE